MGISRYPAFPAPSVISRAVRLNNSGKNAPRDCGLTSPSAVMPRHRVSPAASPMTGSGGASSTPRPLGSITTVSGEGRTQSPLARTTSGCDVIPRAVKLPDGGATLALRTSSLSVGHRAFSSEVGTGSREENASEREIRAFRSDSIGTEEAPAGCGVRKS
jgi:hypothetical protein